MCNELANCTNFSEPKHSKTALQFVYSDFIQNSEIHREMVEWINFQNKFARAVCTVLQYGLWSFQTGYIKLERFLHKNQHTHRIFFNFENWTNGEPQYQNQDQWHKMSRKNNHIYFFYRLFKKKQV